jgi:large subunit ribosomal protein L7/L12
MADMEKLVDMLSELTVLEAAELVKALEEKWGVSAAAPVAAAAAAGPAAVEEAVEEQTEFDVILKNAGPKKIETIKVIRQLTSLGLVDAKNMAEAADSKILTGVAKETAEDAKKKLQEAGAEVVVA